ncbi:YxlC family protein [Bacillus sp. CLL-7-23]|uniref:YxlC family protein n=1 Tax=Bacillus changyiensis TaxID=3004103 RepID=A0ABT4WYW9_9BACI|nr:YxlC family protein [Bacillus changyiensis]MDA7025243.1 YxlC family protein [Bacillus changyiensis]
MKERDEKETISHLKQELKKIDDIFEPASPPQFELDQRLALFKKERKRAVQKELLCFIMSAFVILSVYITISIRVPVIFLTVQGVAFVLLPVLLLLKKKWCRKIEMEGD